MIASEAVVKARTENPGHDFKVIIKRVAPTERRMVVMSRKKGSRGTWKPFSTHEALD